MRLATLLVKLNNTATLQSTVYVSDGEGGTKPVKDVNVRKDGTVVIR